MTMTSLLKYLAVVALTCLLALFLVQSNAFAADGGGRELASRDEVWRDLKRNRDVPVRIVAPAKFEGSLPVILFSHGLGGSLEGGKLWAAEWAAHGFMVVSLQHAGSDESIWKGVPTKDRIANMKGAMTGRNLMWRVGDVKFVLDEIVRRKSDEPSWKQADIHRIGMSGHSFGSRTTMGVAGQSLGPFPAEADPRIRAAIAFSPLGNAKSGSMDKQFANIRMPLFSVTGDLDGEVLGDGTKPEDRTKPFANMPGPDKYLAVMAGGDHMVFGGHNTRNDTDRRIQKDVKAMTLAFWNAYLKDDVKAKTWLQVDAATSLSPGDRFEFK